MHEQPSTAVRSADILAVCAGVLAAIVAAVLSPRAAAEPIGPEQAPAMRQVADSHGRFTIEFPEDWVVRWVGDRYLRLPDNAVHDGVVGIGPARAGGSRADVIVDVRRIPAAMSAAAAAANAETGLRRLAAYRSLQDGQGSAGGVPAYYRFFTHIANGVRVFQAQMYVTEGRQLYVLSGTTPADRGRIPHEFLLILRIIGTFRLLPQH